VDLTKEKKRFKVETVNRVVVNTFFRLFGSDGYWEEEVRRGTATCTYLSKTEAYFRSRRSLIVEPGLINI
jgi:hypothetical protein